MTVRSLEPIHAQLDIQKTPRIKGRSKGGFTTKIHALVDALGNPLKFTLTPGQRNEITQAPVLTENIYNSTVVADKGYDSNAFVTSLESKGSYSTKTESKSTKVLR